MWLFSTLRSQSECTEDKEKMFMNFGGLWIRLFYRTANIRKTGHVVF